LLAAAHACVRGSLRGRTEGREENGIAIQSKTGVDLRLDVVTTSEDEQSVYLALNQAF